ncbi:TIGR01440 family protein [Virgibacillus ndiopensis]|uniref:TIGR01440 family protein n=1 Tax=Virgibacillus ndiopensis TaxID=2004408 RepID=UPI000C06A3D3|nr:TIGR01440 family protein [Virgibacillus ndiopensis]
MVDFNQQVQNDTRAVIDEWLASQHLREGNLFVIGCSTSEIAGKHIGTAGSEELAAIVFAALEYLKSKMNIKLAFQCCEHLNRALVVEQKTMDTHKLEQVSVIPAPTAGGSMASYAYKHMKNPVVVETIQAHAGIDIGETMIGMHMKRVAIPLRFNQRKIGNARVTAARTRPKLIGGERAIYKDTAANNSCK